MIFLRPISDIFLGNNNRIALTINNIPINSNISTSALKNIIKISTVMSGARPLAKG